MEDCFLQCKISISVVNFFFLHQVLERFEDAKHVSCSTNETHRDYR